MATVGAPRGAGVRKGRPGMEQLVAPIAFVAFVVLWGAFAVALVFAQGSLDAAWDWIRSLPLMIQLVVWLLFLPVVAGLWVWHTDWSLILRVAAVAGLAIVTLSMFLPKSLLGPRQ